MRSIVDQGLELAELAHSYRGTEVAQQEGWPNVPKLLCQQFGVPHKLMIAYVHQFQLALRKLLQTEWHVALLNEGIVTGVLLFEGVDAIEAEAVHTER